MIKTEEAEASTIGKDIAFLDFVKKRQKPDTDLEFSFKFLIGIDRL